MNKSDSIKELATALCKFQSEVEGASKNSVNKNNLFTHKYANLEEVISTIKDPMLANGLSYTQTFTESTDTIKSVSVTKNGEVIEDYRFLVNITTTLMHTSGEWMSGTLSLPITKNEPQQVGVAITYARRYSLCAMLGLHQEDDDAESHRLPDNPKPTKKQEAPADTPEKLRERIFNAWKQLEYNFIHQKNSLKDKTGFEELKDITDMTVLRTYLDHMIDTYKNKQAKANEVK